MKANQTSHLAGRKIRSTGSLPRFPVAEDVGGGTRRPEGGKVLDLGLDGVEEPVDVTLEVLGVDSFVRAQDPRAALATTARPAHRMAGGVAMAGLDAQRSADDVWVEIRAEDAK